MSIERRKAITRQGTQGPDWDAATYDRIADPMTRWGAAVLERLHLEQLSEQDRQPFLREVMRQLGEPVIDYVRLNLLARRGGDG